MSAFSLLLINYLVNLAATDYINYFILLLQYILISINFQWICFFIRLFLLLVQLFNQLYRISKTFFRLINQQDIYSETKSKCLIIIRDSRQGILHLLCNNSIL